MELRGKNPSEIVKLESIDYNIMIYGKRIEVSLEINFSSKVQLYQFPYSTLISI